MRKKLLIAGAIAAVFRNWYFSYRLMRSFVSMPRALVKATRLALRLGPVYVHHGW